MMDKRALSIILLLGIVCLSTGRGNVTQPAAHFAPAKMLAESELLTRIKNDIKTAYQDLEQPRYRFTREAAPPSNAVSELTTNGFAVNDRECADREVDVCFSYCLTKDGQKWNLMISKVGPYAVLFRKRGTNQSQYVPPKKQQMTPPEQSIASTLNKSQITLIDFPTLSSRVNLKCQNTPRTRVLVYQALFRDLPNLPWLSR